MEDASTTCYFSVVRTACLNRALGRGTILGLLGIFPLMLGAILLPAKLLHGLGIVLFAFFLVCLLCGLLPFKRLARKQLHPDTLYIEDALLVYTKEGSVKRRIPINHILSLRAFTYSTSDYGIELVLQDKRHLLLPYFTDSSAASLQEELALELLEP